MLKMSEEIEIFSSTTSLKFRHGQKVTDIKRVVFPVIIAGTQCKVNAMVGAENTPLLLSKLLLKKCNTVIHMTEDKASVFRQDIDLHHSTRWHYQIDVISNSQKSFSIRGKFSSQRKMKTNWENS